MSIRKKKWVLIFYSISIPVSSGLVDVLLEKNFLTFFFFFSQFIFVVYVFNGIKCPSCKEKFFYNGWFGNTFASKCVNCGYLPKDGE